MADALHACFVAKLWVRPERARLAVEQPAPVAGGDSEQRAADDGEIMSAALRERNKRHSLQLRQRRVPIA